jgi:hypothetical protein
MGIWDRIRNALAGPPRVQTGGDEGAEAALHEEFGTPTEGDAELKHMEETGGGGGASTLRYGASQAAEVASDTEASAEPARDDLTSEEARDPDS